VAGFAIDQGGWQWGFVVVSALGVLVAAAGLVGSRTSRRVTARGAAADSEHGVAAASMEH
jgi:hypothetical protein